MYNQMVDLMRDKIYNLNEEKDELTTKLNEANANIKELCEIIVSYKFREEKNFCPNFALMGKEKPDCRVITCEECSEMYRPMLLQYYLDKYQIQL